MLRNSNVCVVLCALIGLLFFASCSEKGAFITRWEVPDSCMLYFPAQGDYQFRWRFENEPFGEWNTASIVHGEVLALPLDRGGVYDIEVKPEGFERFQMVIGDTLQFEEDLLYDSLYVVGSSDYLREVLSWGDVKWSSMRLAFATCADLNIRADAGVPDLSRCTDCAAIFYKCTNLETDLHSWKVNSVKTWQDAFAFCPKMTPERQPSFQ